MKQPCNASTSGKGNGSQTGGGGGGVSQTSRGKGGFCYLADLSSPLCEGGCGRLGSEGSGRKGLAFTRNAALRNAQKLKLSTARCLFTAQFPYLQLRMKANPPTSEASQNLPRRNLGCERLSSEAPCPPQTVAPLPEGTITKIFWKFQAFFPSI